MAANDYYNGPAWTDRPTVDYNAPLPPTPPSPPGKASGATSAGRPVSPVISPFADHTYPAPSGPASPSGDHRYPDEHHPGQPYHGGSSSEYFDGQVGGRDHHGANPFADDIPLKAHPSNASSDHAHASGHRHGRPMYNPEPGRDGTDQLEAGPKRRRVGRGSRLFQSKDRIPWFVYTMTVIQVSVFIGQIIRNAILTGSPIMIKPQFNPMIGPSTYVQINMGARFVPCMRSTPGVQDAQQVISWPCPNTTSSDPTNPRMSCSLSDLCGFSGVPNPRPGGKLDDRPQPNQWFRFIVPIFLHAGLVHISFNMLLQLTLGRDMEKSIGPLRFALVYFSSGIFGFVMGGNFAASGIASTGASGCLFGMLALDLLGLLYTWKERRSPGKDLAYIILGVVISFVLGLLPGLDNFSHIGGFLMGLVLGICLLHSPNALRQRIGQGGPPYRPVATDTRSAVTNFVRQPLGFFQGRKAFWWVWWLFRAGALIGVLVAFIVLLNNFYKFRTECKWCKYLSCLPINNWCDIGNLHLTNTNGANGPSSSTSTTPAATPTPAFF